MANVILEAKGITKLFPGVLALDHVDFTLEEGEVHALVGENGAGKSTLMQILAGVYSMNSGEIFLNGAPVEIRNPLDAQKLGIGIVFQELSLIPELSVAENMYPNRQPAAAGFIRKKELYAKAREIIDIFQETIDPATPVKYLTIAKQQMVEIMKVLSFGPRVLILDEPTSSLTQLEADRLFANIKQLQRRKISIIYISHHLPELFLIARRATVLRDGKVVSTVAMNETVTEDKIVGLMVGREVTHKHVDRTSRIDRRRVVLEAKNLSHLYHFKDISFKVHRGEILGFSGLIGAGRSEIAKAIFGLEKLTRGELYLEGKKITIRNPAEAMKKGIAYTSENRKFDGLFLNMSIAHNCSCPQLEKFSGPGGFLRERRIGAFSAECIKKFNIISSSGRQLVRNLSGGNQQKVLLSMWLGIEPKLLMVDEPTKGVDVGAKEEIYGIIRALADTGVAVIVISSDLLEILTISDRVAVLRDGRITGMMDIGEADEEKVISCATGQTRKEAV
ncbi:MAG: sugar ABC transporter ATP-binding protein [Treponema sp.]|nr:sugar ABC transporter ATP-binding protein [Treponema sp.]